MRFVRQNQQVIPETIKDLTIKTQEILEVSGDGLVIYFADEDFSRYPNPRYHNLAFHMNISTGDIEEFSPSDIIEIMKDPSTINFVWLSNWWRRGDIHFVWLYAHELKHLIQDLRTPDIHNQTERLMELYKASGRSTIYQYELPVEYDADLAAKYVCERLFLREQVNDFFEMMIREGTRGKSFEVLRSVNGTLTYDYVQETDSLIRTTERSQ